MHSMRKSHAILFYPSRDNDQINCQGNTLFNNGPKCKNSDAGNSDILLHA